MAHPLLIVESNIDQVLASIARTRSAAVEAPVAAMDRVGHWSERAKTVATQALMVVASVEHRRFIGDVVDSVRADRVGTRALELRAHYQKTEGAEKGLNLEEEIGQFNPLFRDELMDILEAWVRDEKHKDDRDMHADGTPKSDQEIAEGLYAILFHPDETSFGRDLARESFLHSTNPTGLLSYAARFQDAGLPSAILSQWYDVIWDAWANMLSIELPDQVRQEFQRLRRVAG